MPNDGVERGLDGVNFFLADVRDGLGPYLAIYLLTAQHWDAARIGIVMTVMGLATVVAQTPAGVLVDAIKAKRGLIAGASLVVPAAAIAILLLPRFWPVVAAKAVMGAASAVFGPAIAAITLGGVATRRFTARIGRNEGFNHFGNAAAGLLAAAGGQVFGPVAVFYLVALFGLGSAASVLVIPPKAIDHARARGGTADGEAAPAAGLGAVFANRTVLVFAASIALFHLANAAMLPLVGQKLALIEPREATPLMALCVVGAQIVMVPMAMLCGARADRWGRKPIFLAAFAILPLRGALYTLSNAPAWLLSVQLMDGIGAGIFGALFPLVVADLTRGTGRFNVTLGALATVQGLGAALSTTVGGFAAARWGYGTAFIVLAAVAAAAFLLFLCAMPETRDLAQAPSSRRRTRAASAA